MTIIGKTNWWLPGWLDKLLPHVSVESEEDFEAGASEIEDIDDPDDERQESVKASDSTRAARCKCCRALRRRHEFCFAGFPASFGHLDQALEVGLTGGTGDEEDEERRGFTGLVPEAVESAFGDVGEVARMSIDPVLAVVQLHGT